MNLRQRIKHAKKEIKLLDTKKYTCEWDMYTQFKKRSDLQDIINKKKRFNQYVTDQNILKDDKVTYMELSCGTKKLMVTKNANGKALSNEQMLHFVNRSAELVKSHAPIIHEQYKDNEKLPNNFHVIYLLSHSIDRTKGKTLVTVMNIYQFKNNKSLYIKRGDMWKKIHTFD